MIEHPALQSERFLEGLRVDLCLGSPNLLVADDATLRKYRTCMKSCPLRRRHASRGLWCGPGHVKVEGWLASLRPLTGQLSRVVAQRECRDGDRPCSGVWDARV